MLKRIYFFYFAYMASMYFAQTFIVFWLSQNGYSFSQLLIYFAVAYAVALAGIFFFPKVQMSAKRCILFGLLFSVLQVFVLIKFFSSYQLYLSALFSGLNILFFWIPYNIMHFKFSQEDSRGLHSGMYFLITPIIGITLQPFAGVVAERFGFETLFLIGIFAYIIPLILLKFLPSFNYEINVRKYFLEHRFNWSTFFQGMTSRVNFSLIPIFTLFFIKTPRQFGNFFGYLAIMTAIASVINGHISDKLRKRKIFFYFFSFLAVISFLPLAFVDNIYYWSIFAGIGSLCVSLASPFWLTFNLDYYKNIGVEKTMVLREVFLNMGYIATLFICLLVFYFTSSPKTSLIIVSAICLLLPVASYFQGIYRDTI
ncbi:MAG: MFS transporter [Candidatus Pacebacteria bacterium]|nr:MFS transporter [Candidatus Paceibacterota bacterium]